VLLQIYRDFPRPGLEAAYRALEEEAARVCAELRFPHVHFAIESLSAPVQIWWLNAFESEADREQVTRAYTSNAGLVRALEDVGRRKQGLVETPVDVLAHHRADLSRGPAWQVAGVRFFAVEITKDEPRMAGAVFEAPDGTRYVFRPAHSAAEAEQLATAAHAITTVFAVRPYWGLAAEAWIAADPEFWNVNPAAQR
jgi:hypothetical protein